MAAKKRSKATRAFRPNGQDAASSFVGRAAELTAIAERLDRARLVTILGPGGIGKTRLALRTAANLGAEDAHPGGVWFCDLTEARHRADIAATVASTLGVRFFEGDSGRDDATAMIAELGVALERRGGLVLVLDNLEHLIDDARMVVHAWLRAAPETRFLATSRISLGLPGEELWPLPPLPGAEAADLFLARARQVRPDVATTEADLAAVSAIVQTLEGMPLAIELAASRMEIMSPAQLSQRLERPLDLLSRAQGQHDKSQPDKGRHASVRRTVLDSGQLLSTEDRAAFVACAVFRDGFALEAAEAVVGASAMDRLASLTRSSLVRAVQMKDAATRCASRCSSRSARWRASCSRKIRPGARSSIGMRRTTQPTRRSSELGRRRRPLAIARGSSWARIWTIFSSRTSARSPVVGERRRSRSVSSRSSRCAV